MQFIFLKSCNFAFEIFFFFACKLDSILLLLEYQHKSLLYYSFKECHSGIFMIQNIVKKECCLFSVPKFYVKLRLIEGKLPRQPNTDLERQFSWNPTFTKLLVLGQTFFIPSPFPLLSETLKPTRLFSTKIFLLEIFLVCLKYIREFHQLCWPGKSFGIGSKWVIMLNKSYIPRPCL